MRTILIGSTTIYAKKRYLDNMFIKRLYSRIKEMYNRSSNERYIKYLRKKGVVIGKGVRFLYPAATTIDTTRPSLVKIGNNCFFNKNFTLLTHDWVTHVFIHAGLDFLPSSGRVLIGNNVSFGYNVMVLKGVTIGDNVFIGANSLVSKDIPSNCVATGTPCKVIYSLEDYYAKRVNDSEIEALEYAKSIQERFGRIPVMSDFREEFPLFLDGAKVKEYPDFIPVVRHQLGPMYDNYVKSHHAKYKGLDSFLNAAGVDFPKDE